MKMAIKRENEARIRGILEDIGIKPVRFEERKDRRLLSLILPNMTDQERDKFEKSVPTELFAFRGYA